MLRVEELNNTAHDLGLHDLVLQIGNFNLNFVIDPGSFENIMSWQLLKTLQYEKAVAPCNRNIILINGSALIVVGEILLYVNLNDQINQMRLVII